MGIIDRVKVIISNMDIRTKVIIVESIIMIVVLSILYGVSFLLA